jgi:hypothetical protein
MYARVAARPDIPQQPVILANLSAARAALTPASGASWRRNVQLAVSNASGQSTGVGGQLANGAISFIDYYAAPSPTPPAPPSNAGPDTNATTGRPWGGPGGTPGFNPTRIQGIGSALAMLQRWAEQWSMLNAAFAAWNEIAEREGEIIDAQNENPLYPVYIRIYWRVIFENNPNTPKTYEYFGADIKNGAGGQPASLYDANQHSYLMVIPALNGAGPNVVSQALATWRDGYVSVLGSLRGDRSVGGDPIEALRTLNGSPMYDNLSILETLKVNQPFLFDKLQQAILWPSANVGRDRLTAAFAAVRMSDTTGVAAFQAYVVSCNEYSHLPDDQKKSIEEFLSLLKPSAAEVRNSPIGKWQVSIGDWCGWFVFKESKACAWADSSGGVEHRGNWWIGGGEVQWSYSDDPKGWERVFHARLPLRKKVSGQATTNGIDHGYYTMTKQ